MRYTLQEVVNPFYFPVHFLRHRRLVWQFAIRDFVAKFRGTYAGILWLIIVPLLMLAVYTFVFSLVFKARWGSTEREADGFFAIVLFTNLFPYTVLSEIIASSPHLIVSNSHLVKKVIFPLEVLVASKVLSVIMQSLLTLAVLLCGLSWVVGWQQHMLYFPVIIMPVVMIGLGISLFVSSLTVFVRDTSQIIGVALTLLMFLSPIFYPISAVPEGLRQYIRLNPLGVATEEFRNVMVFGVDPNWQHVGLLYLVGWGLVYFGFVWFMRIKHAFADVL